MGADHWMMFGTFAQQRVFRYPKSYDGVVINANMVAHAPAGLASFLLERVAAKPRYIIDPLTHAFQHDPASIEGKPSLQKLAQAYGSLVASAVDGGNRIWPEDFKDATKVDLFVRNCVDYQVKRLREYTEETDAAKYLGNDALPPPYAVVAPYFYMSETTARAWLPVNFQSIAVSRQFTGEQRLFASIVLDHNSLIDPTLREEIVDKYLQSDANGFLVWIDGLDEHEAGSGTLKSLLALSKGLRDEGAREVINLHGGFFSVLAGSSLGGGVFSAVTHGPEFGEHRAVVPVGGGLPVARYYIPLLHRRIRYVDARLMLAAKKWLGSKETFLDNVCGCEICKQAIENGIEGFAAFGEHAPPKDFHRDPDGKRRVRIRQFPTGKASNLCLRHYLCCKEQEYKRAEKDSADDLVEWVQQGYREFKSVAGLEGVKHLHLWLRAFERDI